MKTTIETSSAQHAPHPTPQWGEGRHSSHTRPSGKQKIEHKMGTFARVRPQLDAPWHPASSRAGLWHRKEWWVGLRPTAAWEACCLLQACSPNDRHASVVNLKSTCNEPWPVRTDLGEHARTPMETRVPGFWAPGGVAPGPPTLLPLTKPTVSRAANPSRSLLR